MTGFGIGQSVCRTGVFATALDEGEIITAISFPAGGRVAYASSPARSQALR